MSQQGLASARVSAREPYTAPKHPTDPLELPPAVRQILFLHPGYSRERAVLLSLPALDRDNGIQHQTALYACAIVADNRWDGYFSSDREGRERVPTEDMDESLTADEYYFHVPAEPATNAESSPGREESTAAPTKYPVVPTFAEWAFPHGRLPAGWSETLSSSSSQRPQCALTNAYSLSERAHVLPRSDEAWFDTNTMSQYSGIDSPANILPFRVDVHQYFDRKPKFAVLPKYGQPLVHIFNAKGVEAREATELYHNVPVTLSGQDPAFLFARLAWTVFPLLETFLKARTPRRLLRRLESGAVERDESGDRCLDIWRSAYLRPRSESPKKRSRAPEEVQDGYDLADYHSDLDADDYEERHRGRKRHRRGSSTSLTADSVSLTGGSSTWSASETDPATPEHTVQPLAPKDTAVRRETVAPAD